MKRVLSILLSVVMSLCFMEVSAYAEESQVTTKSDPEQIEKAFQNDETVFSSYTLEDEFEDDVVLVTFKKAYSVSSEEYIEELLALVDCTKMEDVFYSSGILIREQIKLIEKS
ncbi:MAG: hypothetical protein IJ043_09990 [Clostridia bacterium]|nr:hypothetical protein [Clostridia bacterium]